MPLYEYRCNECSREFTLLVGVTATKAKRACPKCGSRKITKLISRPSPLARGGGFDGDLSESDLDAVEGDLGDDDFGGDDDELSCD